MSLSDLAALGSFVSGVAVLISLILLYFQLRQVNAQVVQAERNQQAAIRQGRATRTVEMLLETTSPSVADALTKGWAGITDISETQFYQFAQVCRATFVNSEDTFYQHAEGLLNEAAFASFVAGMKGSFRAAGFRAQWKRARSNYGTDFVQFMDKMRSEVPVEPSFDVFALWKADVARELSRTNA